MKEFGIILDTIKVSDAIRQAQGPEHGRGTHGPEPFGLELMAVRQSRRATAPPGKEKSPD